MTEIRLYIEGAGSDAISKRELRKGFSTFLNEIVERVRAKGIRWQIVACGPRQEAFKSFNYSLRARAEAFNVLLVDSEGTVNATNWRYLRDHDDWRSPGANDENCHLMVPLMEAWLIADTEALSEFFGSGFNESAIPKNPNVEEIDKDRIIASLVRATQNTTKGTYHKTKHGFVLMARVDPRKVQEAAPHCKLLFECLLQKITQ